MKASETDQPMLSQAIIKVPSVPLKMYIKTASYNMLLHLKEETNRNCSGDGLKLPQVTKTISSIPFCSVSK
jgi:hypothetical protein